MGHSDRDETEEGEEEEAEGEEGEEEEEEEEEDDEQGGEEKMLGFIFGNVDEDGALEEEYMDEVRLQSVYSE